MSLPLNEQYKEMFSPMIETAKSIGRALGPRIRRSPKAVDTSQYSGIKDTVKKNLPAELGTVTVPWKGKTRFEDIHRGIDYSRGADSPVSSWTGGRVSEVVTGKVKGSPAFGNYVTIVDPQGNKHRYSHLSESYVPFSVGQQVQMGDVIGLEGNTGQVYSLSGGQGHHVDLRSQSPSGVYINPMQFVNAYQQLMK